MINFLGGINISMKGKTGFVHVNVKSPIVQTTVSASIADSTSHTINWPVTPTPGNLLVLTVSSQQVIGTPPTNWSVAASGIQYTAAYIYYKTASASETGVTVTLNDVGSCALGLYEIRYNVPTSILDYSGSYNLGDNEIFSGFCDTTNPYDILVSVASYNEANGGTTISSWSDGFTKQFYARGVGSGDISVLESATKVAYVAQQGYKTTASLQGHTPDLNVNVGLLAAFKLSHV